MDLSLSCMQTAKRTNFADQACLTLGAIQKHEVNKTWVLPLGG